MEPGWAETPSSEPAGIGPNHYCTPVRPEQFFDPAKVRNGIRDVLEHVVHPNRVESHGGIEAVNIAHRYRPPGNSPRHLRCVRVPLETLHLPPQLSQKPHMSAGATAHIEEPT